MYSVRSIVARRAPFVSVGTVQRAAFSQSIARSVGKESKLHTEGRADEAEQLKQQQLKNQKDGKGKWEEGLASDSESIIKADRSETNTSAADNIKKLQEETAKAAKDQ
ncbi:uncharacterized protein M421DRAFT_278862 [Didymella exigua CBS 183.55]|uniref:Mitochondrial carrier protein PET8 n=1 Tax=Didymella exigua CBS 183.55 TaxID=1150837 RepID=A0A6A5RAU7_9PLEO|nr:uncharacterized protein M421DRAFT_278862 [Didymella exigua CBS 183.55]KAF1924439.1 hypothetical protein M421DRAFT_278862 [Didymella exigua CBS 183.55]